MLAVATHSYQFQSDEQRNRVINLRIGPSASSAIAISVKQFSNRVRLWSLELLVVFQRLLDVPTFMVIMQELVGHEESAVRQKALEILGQRLLLMGDKRAKRAEVSTMHLTCRRSINLTSV